MRETILLSQDWHFYRGDYPDCIGQDIPEAYETVTVPHDYVIGRKAEEDCPYGAAQAFRRRWGAVFYTRDFSCGALEEDRQLFLEFDGVYENCTVYVNGQEAGGHAYGYTSFSLEITGLVREGENRIAVRVDNSAMPPDRWYSGGGIYRPVRLVKVHRCHVLPEEIFVRTGEIKENTAAVLISLGITGGDFVKVAIATKLGPVVSKTVPAGRVHEVLALTVENPMLWSPASPFLYELQLQVTVDGKETDAYAVPFGLRKLELDVEQGLRVNGRQVKLKGVNMHHDGGCLGAAVPRHALYRRLQAFQKMGCNAIRTSHNPPSRELLELCDRMGLFVVDEALDKWVSGSYERYYPEHGVQDVQAMVRRDRNHPCILIWSVGNEVADQGSDAMLGRLKELTDAVRALDATRPVTYAMVSVFLNDRTQTSREKSALVHRIAEHVDIISCNYQEQWYDTYHADTPDKPILGTEIFPFYRGKGECLKAYYDRNPWLDVEERDYVIGGFVWAGIDYLGEATAWPAKGWTASLMDLFGNRRPVSYLLESFWSHEPMVHITFLDGKKRCDLQKDHWGFPQTSSHWNFAQYGEAAMPFHIYTNCEAVALYLNGQYYLTLEQKDFANRIITGYLPNLPGQVEVKGIKGGEVVCTHVLRTAGNPYKLVAAFDRSRLAADGTDIAYADVQIVDENGIPCPEAENVVRFSVSGPGVLQAVDNGDLLGEHGYHDSSLPAFRGKCGCVVKSTPEAGTVRLAVTAEGLEAAYLTLESREEGQGEA